MSCKFSHISALRSELIAVTVDGQLCQWKWADQEPYMSQCSEVSEKFSFKKNTFVSNAVSYLTYL